MTQKKRAIIIGAGPAGLTAASELLARTDIEVIVLEATGQTGGISQTVEYHGNRLDIGGHRFFSKSDRVMEWWMKVMPVESDASMRNSDKIMLVRNRLSRIYFGRKFYSYPVRLDMQTMRNLGAWRMIRIGFSYVKAWLKPIKPEESLEDFFINRFGKQLYLTFFKDYTEKVWGVSCREIHPEWGSQRVKGLSVSKALIHALKSVFPKEKTISQKNTETSLIERFLYPKFGPGQLWQEVAAHVQERGGEIRYHCRVTKLEWVGSSVSGLWYRQEPSGKEYGLSGDYIISTMPVRDLILGMGPQIPEPVRLVANGLIYRDFITLGLLFKKMTIGPKNHAGQPLVPDTWIYIQESDVKVGRVQVFNHWSPYLVKDPDTVWLGLEYFCQEGDALWTMPDEQLIQMGVAELEKMGLCSSQDYLDGTVVKMPKTYPAYFGTYDQFDIIRRFMDPIENLFLIGRNGMHRYNNQDHSMLTAMKAVDLILAGQTNKESIWAVNTEDDYHETASK